MILEQVAVKFNGVFEGHVVKTLDTYFNGIIHGYVTHTFEDKTDKFHSVWMCSSPYNPNYTTESPRCSPCFGYSTFIN